MESFQSQDSKRAVSKIHQTQEMLEEKTQKNVTERNFSSDNKVCMVGHFSYLKFLDGKQAFK